MSDNVGQRAFHNARLKKKQNAEAAKLFERAVALVNTGALPGARAVLQQLLQLAPKHFDALYLLGMSEYHARCYGEAEQLLARAIDAEPRSAEVHFHRGVVLNRLGRFEEARASYQRAIALKPQYPAALYNLGCLCEVLKLPDEAIECYDKAIAIKNDFAEAHYNRGLALQQLKRHREAVDSHDRALAIKPRYAEALNGRGNALHDLGRSTEALASYGDALALNPGFAPALYNQGIALSALHRDAEALDSYDRAIAADPTFADAHNNRGDVLRALERYDEALGSHDKAIAINPGLAEAHNGRGAALTHLRDYNQAIESFSRALELRPDFAEALANRGTVWLELKRQDEAIANFDAALALNPALAEAWVFRGRALLVSKRTSEAIASAENALAMAPDLAIAHTLIGMALAALGDIEGALGRFDAALAIKPNCETTIAAKIFVLDFSADAGFEQHRDIRQVWWEQIGSRIAAPRQHYLNNRDPERRLVLGYLSPDFRNHSAAAVFKPMFQYKDKQHFEVVCYSCSPVRDKMTEEFEAMADRWNDASRWSDGRLADQIRHDQIDILIDLAGHTEGNRLSVIARKPAPIVVHGWGHCTPPGLPTIDYVFADPVTIPMEVRHLYKETIWDLPCMLTLEALPAEVPRTALPALANGYVTFGVFNRISKISKQAAEVWAQILQRVPGSKLLIKDTALDDTLVRENLLTRLARHGIAADRVELRGGSPRLQHLAAFNDVDICLDPFPQNGGASTWEALRMGVPVLAKIGNALPRRAAAGILTAVGLGDWVAESSEDYIAIAIKWTTDIDDLARLRRELPGRLAASAAGNPETYASEVGKAYRTMWQTYCAREAEPPPPESL